MRGPSVSLSFFLFLSLFSLFSAPALSLPTSTQPPSLSPSTACKFTRYPKLCRSILSTFKSPPSSDPYTTTYGKFSVKQSLKQARKMADTMNRYLSPNKKQRLTMSHEEAGAFDDCRQLSQLNVDYLESIMAELKSAESLSDELVDRVKSLLSAIVTNQQTCHDGLKDCGSSMVSALSEPFFNATELYSVALGLINHELSRTRRQHKRSVGRFLSEVNRVREPSSTLIKVLQKKHNSLNASKEFHKGKRILAQLMDGGIGVNNTVTVSPNGNENFTNIGEAIAFAPNNSKAKDGYFVIYIREGYYEEYVIVPSYKKSIMLIGDGINRTVITGNHNKIDGWTTYNSSTFAVSGERFVCIDITFKNTAGPEKHQAVAVRNNADLSTFYRCSFEGYQDTLYVHSQRQFYRECDIYGTIDFIFGNSASVFQSCNLFARKPLPDQKNAFTAQGRTDPNQNTGISIQNCTIEAAPDLAMDLNSTTLNYLGRPWKEYSRTVYMQSYIGSLINPVGWLEWNGTVGLDTLYYGEFQNYGPGANTSMRVQWPGYSLMNASQAMNFTVYNFTMGDTWLPDAQVPFFGGLL